MDGDFLGLKRYLGSYPGVLGGGVILFGRSGYEEISPFFGGDRDKPVILEPRRRTRASLFQLQSRTCQERGLQRLWEERLSVGHPEFSACWGQGLQKPGCSGHPSWTVERPRVPVRHSPQPTRHPPSAWRGFSVLGMILGFALAAGRHSREQRAGHRSVLPFREGKRPHQRDPQLTPRGRSSNERRESRSSAWESILTGGRDATTAVTRLCPFGPGLWRSLEWPPAKGLPGAA